MKKIRLVVFNEAYWDKGLIYSQNILPLLQLVKKKKCTLDIVSFTSLPFLFMSRKDIQATKDELLGYGVNIKNFPILFYPTRFMLLRHFLLPFYFLNVFFYIKLLNRIDAKYNSKILYSIRSYQAALGFLKFYDKKERIIFDTRTDWIEENINVGNFRENGRTVRYWRKKEKLMLQLFNKTLFISPVFRKQVLSRNDIKQDENKYPVVFNPINYKHFESIKNKDTNNNFLYTGSLGHWNNLSVYLDFFMQVASNMPSSKLIVCTNSPKHKVMPILSNAKYASIRNRVELYFNISYSKLPEYYARCTFGLQLMSKKDSRVGVKYIEYVASGLVPIVNENVMGAAALSREYNIGVVLDGKNKNKLPEILEKAKKELSTEVLRTFKSMTDLNQMSEILKPIYLE